ERESYPKRRRREAPRTLSHECSLNHVPAAKPAPNRCQRAPNSRRILPASPSKSRRHTGNCPSWQHLAPTSTTWHVALTVWCSPRCHKPALDALEKCGTDDGLTRKDKRHVRLHSNRERLDRLLGDSGRATGAGADGETAPAASHQR